MAYTQVPQIPQDAFETGQKDINFSLERKKMKVAHFSIGLLGNLKIATKFQQNYNKIASRPEPWVYLIFYQKRKMH